MQTTDTVHVGENGHSLFVPLNKSSPFTRTLFIFPTSTSADPTAPAGNDKEARLVNLPPNTARRALRVALEGLWDDCAPSSSTTDAAPVHEEKAEGVPSVIAVPGANASVHKFQKRLRVDALPPIRRKTGPFGANLVWESAGKRRKALKRSRKGARDAALAGYLGSVEPWLSKTALGSYADEGSMRTEADLWMESYENLEAAERAAKQAQANYVDEDGFTLVQRRTKKTGGGDGKMGMGVASAAAAAAAARKASTKRAPADLYAFQVRSKKLDRLAGFRSAWEADKAALARMRAERKFNPN